MAQPTFGKDQIVHIVGETIHAGKQGTFVKHNGGPHGDQVMIRIDQQGVLQNVFVRIQHVRSGRLPISATPPPPVGKTPPVTPPSPATNDELVWCQRIIHCGVPAKSSAREAKEDAGYVYVFQNPDNPGHVKVGRSRTTENRLRAARVYVPKMRMMACFWAADYVRAERLAHELLREYRTRQFGSPGNEWFQVSVSRASCAVMRACQL